LVRQTAAVITFEIIGGILLLAIAGAIGVAFLLARGPVELNLFKADIEKALIEARNGRDVEIDRLTLQWSPSDRRMVIAAANLKLADNRGQLAGEAAEATITLDAGSLIFGRAEVIRTDLRGGWVDVRKLSPTQWTFAGEPLPEFEARQLPVTAEGWLSLANRALGEVLEGLDVNRRISPLERASFDQMDLRFRGEDGRLLGEMEDAGGFFEQTANGLAVEVGGSGQGIGLPGDVTASLAIPASYTSIDASASIANWSVGDLAARFGIADEYVAGFPADIGVGLRYEHGDGIRRINLSADAEQGTLSFLESELNVDALRFETSYEPATDHLEIASLAVSMPRYSGTVSGTVNGFVKADGPVEFDLQSDDIQLDYTPYFPKAWSASDVTLTGTLNEGRHGIDVDRYAATLSGLSFSGSASLAAAPDNVDGELPFTLSLSGETDGTFTKETVLNYWPETLGAGARSFAVRKVLEGTVTAASYQLDLKPDSFDQGFLRDEDLSVRFFVEDASVKFLDNLPPVTDATGSGRLTGNGFSVQISEALYDGWELSEGSVQFPRFNPKGEMFRVYAKGEGPVVNVMRNIANSRLMQNSQNPLDPERFSGSASATFEMLRPALDNVPMEAIDIKVTGEISEAGLTDAIPGLDLSKGSADVLLEDNQLVITGFGDLGPAPVQFSWRDNFDDDSDTADLSASAFISPDFLNRFGIIGRAYVSDDIPVELQAKVGGAGLDAVEVGFELQQSRIDVSEVGYIKPAGQPARATLAYDAKSEIQASTFRYVSEDARFDGDVVLSQAGQLQSLQMREAYLDDFMDVRGSIKRRENGRLVSELTGAYLDVSAFFGDFGAVGEGASGVSLPVSVSANLDVLRLRDGLDLEDAKLNFESANSGVREVRATGTIETGGALSALYAGPTTNEPARIRLESDDAGFFMRALLRQDFLSDGSLALEGTLAQGATPAKLNLSLANVRMRDAPFLTQVLSLASLRGLADTLGGDGVLFSTIDVPVTIQSGRFIIDGARANGPALGLTMNGWFQQDTDEIRLSGVLVPSFGMNSMLGGVPVIGDLFVGREGEGIFSLTYSVRGTTDKAQVAVNPLSAVTPGILRRIFENPADTSIPENLPVDPDKTPPAPPMPDAEFIEPAPGSDG
jgi:hypothetical protein